MKRVSFIYIIGPENWEDAKCFKLGITETPNQRIVAIQNGNHEPLMFWWILDVPSEYVYPLERKLSSALSAYRLKGEWFSHNEESSAFLGKLYDCRCLYDVERMLIGESIKWERFINGIQEAQITQEECERVCRKEKP